MALNAGQMRSRVAAALDLDVSSGDGPTQVLNDINNGGRRVWEMYPWFGRDVETTLFLVAPYDDGTCDFTNGSTTLAGTTTVWTAAMTGRKIARGIGQPYYRFTRTGNTTGTIPTGGYVEPTALASAYVIFQDEYDLASTAETVIDCELYSAAWRGDLARTTEAAMDADRFINPSLGTPRRWAPVLSTTSGIRRLRFDPVPSEVARVRVHYLVAWTDLTAASDPSTQLGSNRERAWFLASCLEAQRAADVRQITTEEEVLAACAEAFAKERPASPVAVRRTPVGGGRRRPLYYTDDTNAT